nr:hypothetical protein [Nanoarchaeum sp.]
MVNVVDRIVEGAVKRWYQINSDPALLNMIVRNAEEEGYVLDPNSGLLFRDVNSEELSIDIIFPRPTDFHYHKDVHENIEVLSGKGIFINHGHEAEYFGPGKEISVPHYWNHAFRPSKHGALEVRVTCSGVWDPAQEVVIERFDSFEPWVRYFNNFRGR